MVRERWCLGGQGEMVNRCLGGQGEVVNRWSGFMPKAVNLPLDPASPPLPSHPHL